MRKHIESHGLTTFSTLLLSLLLMAVSIASCTGGGGEGDASPDAAKDASHHQTGDGGTDGDADSDGDTDGDTDTDTDGDADGGADGGKDAGPPCSYDCLPGDFCLKGGGLVHPEMTCSNTDQTCCEITDAGVNCPSPFLCVPDNRCVTANTYSAYHCDTAGSVCCNIELCAANSGTCRADSAGCQGSEIQNDAFYCAGAKVCCMAKQDCTGAGRTCRAQIAGGCKASEKESNIYTCSTMGDVCCVVVPGCELSGGHCRTIIPGCRTNEHVDNQHSGCSSLEVCCM